MINKEETDINSESFRKYFSFQRLSEMLKAAFTTYNRTKNEKLVNGINSVLSDLKDELEKMSHHENNIEKPDKIGDSGTQGIIYSK